MSRKTISVTEFHRDAHAIIQAAQQDDDIIYIMQDGCPPVVLLSYEQYENIIAQTTQTTWPPNYFEQTYGVLADDPITRLEQGDYPEREPFS